MNGFVRDMSTREWDQEVLGSETPALVEVWTGWCPPCHRLDPIVEKTAKDRAGELRTLKLDAEENPSIAIKYGVWSLPTLVLFSGGTEQGRVVGAPRSPG